MRTRIHYPVLGALILFFIGSSALWIHLNRTPPSWDEAYYLTNSLSFDDAFAAGGVGGLGHEFLYRMKAKPPLIAALAIPAYCIAGRRAGAAYAVNLVFMFILFASLFYLGEKYASERAGLVAVFVAGTMPMLYALSRMYLVECGLTALVCLFISVIDGFQQNASLARASIVGLLFGLGMLMKASFPLYVAVPAIYFTLRKRNAMWGRRFWIACLTGSAVALPWYLVNFSSAWTRALNAGSVRAAKVYRTGEIMSWPAIGGYLGNLINTGPAIYFLLLAIMTLLFASRLSQLGKEGVLLCVMWSSPVLFLVFGHFRDLRYAAPLFPSVALALGIFIDSAVVGRGTKAWTAVCAVLVLPLADMLHTSFGILGQNRFELGALLLIQQKFAQARKYDGARWPQDAILRNLLRSSTTSVGAREPVLVLTDSVHFNADNFQLAALLGRFPFDLQSTAYESDPTAVLALVHSSSYLIYKDGGEPDEPNFNLLGTVAIQETKASGTFRELPIARTLPDGGIAHVFANIAQSGPVQSSAFIAARFRALEKCDVMFSGRIQLAGCLLTRGADGLEVRLRWVALERVDRDYWCFAHVLDANGKVVGFLDHPIANGNPSTRDWKPGDEAFERLLFASKQGPLRLRLGIYDRRSGDRLPISRAQFPVTDNQTAAIIDEQDGNRPVH